MSSVANKLKSVTLERLTARSQPESWFQPLNWIKCVTVTPALSGGLCGGQWACMSPGPRVAVSAHGALLCIWMINLSGRGVVVSKAAFIAPPSAPQRKEKKTLQSSSARKQPSWPDGGFLLAVVKRMETTHSHTHTHTCAHTSSLKWFPVTHILSFSSSHTLKTLTPCWQWSPQLQRLVW